MPTLKLRHQPSKIIIQLLQDLQRGTDPANDLAWPIYNENMPDGPDKCIAVSNTSGRTFGRTHVDGETQAHYGIQIRVRSPVSDITAGYLKCKAILEDFDRKVKRTEVVLDSIYTYLVQSINNVGTVSNALKEAPESRRRLFTGNCLAVIRLNSIAGTGTGS